MHIHMTEYSWPSPGRRRFLERGSIEIGAVKDLDFAAGFVYQIKQDRLWSRECRGTIAAAFHLHLISIPMEIQHALVAYETYGIVHDAGINQLALDTLLEMGRVHSFRRASFN